LQKIATNQYIYFELNSSTIINVIVFGINLEYIDLRGDINTTEYYSLETPNDLVLAVEIGTVTVVVT
jgi:hypothetical protein